MKPDDLLDAATDQSDPWGAGIALNLRHDLLGALIKGRYIGDEVEIADAVVRLTHREFEGFANQGSALSDDADADVLLRACAVACKRVGLDFPKLPFRDFSSFGKYWRREGMTGPGSWAVRREYLDQLFDPIEAELLNLLNRGLDDRLAQPISPRSSTGWAVVDREVDELRRRFEVARSDQDHSAVGTACVRILEHLGDVSFDPDRYLQAGQPSPPRDKTKARFDLIIAHELAGADHEAIRKLTRGAVELAHEVKHRTTPTRRDAGIAADAVILLTNIMRRILGGVKPGGVEGAA